MTMSMKRRTFVKGGVATVLASSAVVVGLLKPEELLAAWNEKAFSSKSVDEALKAGFGGSEMEASDKVVVEAPDVAANGAMVQVSVESQVPNTESVALVAEKNAWPLCCVFRPGPGVRPKMKLRVKMGKTSNVVGVVKADGKLYTAKRSVKVTAGGCG